MAFDLRYKWHWWEDGAKTLLIWRYDEHGNLLRVEVLHAA